MKDFAISEDPAVQEQLDRLSNLPLPQGGLGLDKIRLMLDRLGNPERDLPPVFHVAGTNGKGSTCAFLRAMLEAEGYTVHVATKPHLCRYNERIRLAGELIPDAMLASLLKEVLDTCEDIGGELTPSFFEVTTAAMFLAFARVPADVCVIEVGLGGRFDATNVLETAIVSGIASLGVDHDHFLLAPDPSAPQVSNPLVRIAFEKAGIATKGVPLVTQAYAEDVAERIALSAEAAGAPLMMRGEAWQVEIGADGIAYSDQNGALALPLPTMPGAHQAENASLAAAMVRHQSRLPVSQSAISKGIRSAKWPARLQILSDGPVTQTAPGRKFILDGGHNPDAAEALAKYLATQDGKVDALIGMMAAKDARRFLGVLAPYLWSVTAVPIAGNDHLDLDTLAEIARDAGVERVTSAPDVPAALDDLPERDGGSVLIAGSLYLAGQVLAANEELPD